jgi:hypothetical protein
VSYLLEALKRLEEKHQDSSSSDLLSVQVNAKQKSKKRRLVWPYFLSIALLANAAVATWWFFSSHNIPHPDVPTISPENKPSPKITFIPDKAPFGSPNENNTAHNNNEKPARPILKLDQTPAKVLTETLLEMTPSAKRPASPSAISTSELPVTAKNAALPELKVSLHSYSPDPTARLVRINDKTMQEGDSLSPEIKVESITPDGIIIIYLGRRHNLSTRPNP